MARQGKQPFDTENEIFPARLRQLMDETKTTQSDLAEILDVRRQTVSLYMNGQSNPDWKIVAKIAKHFKVTADYLVGIEDARIHKYSGIRSELNLSEKAIERLLLTVGTEDFPMGLAFASWLLPTNAALAAELSECAPNLYVPAEVNAAAVVDYLISNDFLESAVEIISGMVNAQFLTNEVDKLAKIEIDNIPDQINTRDVADKLKDFIALQQWKTERHLLSCFRRYARWCGKNIEVTSIEVNSDKIRTLIKDRYLRQARILLIKKYRHLTDQMRVLLDNQQFQDEYIENLNKVAREEWTESEYEQWLINALEKPEQQEQGGVTDAEETNP